MPAINEASLGAINTGFHVIFAQNLLDPNRMQVVNSVANVTTSTKKEEQYNWLAKLGRVREWIGPRVLNRFKAYGFTIQNKKWEDSVEVDIEDIEDDALGQYIPLIQTMASEANTHYARLLTALLETGFTTGLAYDGQPFFNTSHPVGGRTTVLQSNAATVKISEEGLVAAFDNLANLKDERGEPLGIVYDTLYYHPSKRTAVNELLDSEFLVAGGAFVGYNKARDIVRNRVELPYMSDPEKWFLADTSRPIKPLILQIRKRAQFQQVTNMNDGTVFASDKYKYGVRMRHNAGYSLWQLAYGSDGTTNPS